MINRKKITIVITVVVLIIILGFLSYYFYFFRFQPKELTHTPCLSEDEFADFDYDVDLYESTGVKLPINTTTRIYVKDKRTNEELFKFVIDNVPVNSPSLEIHKCGVYVIRDPFSDTKKGIYKKPQFWHYTYDGNGRILMNEKDFYPYSPIPRVAPSENYIALSQYYQGHPDQAVVIKNLKSSQLEEVLVIKPDDIWQKIPQLNKERNIDVVGWSSDSKYLWGASQSQIDTAYFRININDKNKETLEVFPMPDDAVHHGPPRIDTGYIWYVYGAPWVGFYELGEEIYNEWQKQGKKEILFLYNLFTKEKIVLATVDDPRWVFSPRWLSDNELRYQILSGEIKIYEIKP